MDEANRAIHILACLTVGVLSVAGSTQDANSANSATGVTGEATAVSRETFAERIPGTTVTIEMVRVPGVSADGDALFMSATEITWDAFDVMLFGFDEKDEELEADGFARPSKPYITMDRGFGHDGNPAISMSFRGANAFCEWLSKKTGRRYRLPTETEWEHAALAGSTGPWCSGDDPEALKSYAWFRDNAERTTHPVGKKQPNAFGLYDMHGNAAEWCVRPGVDGTKPKGVVRGGSYKDAASETQADAVQLPQRSWNASDPQIPKSTWWLADAGFVGFRVVCDDQPPQ